MTPKLLELCNWRNFGQATLDFSEIRKTLIIGSLFGVFEDSNGAGKSTMLMAIPWCLWGESPDTDTIDDNVKWGENMCFVKFDFIHDNKEVTVKRTRNVKSSSSTLDFIIDGVVSNGSSVNDTAKKIKEFLNLDYEAYTNSVYIRQDDVASLANAKSNAEARELMERILGLNEYDLYHEEVKAIIRDLELKIEKSKQFVDENEGIGTLMAEAQQRIDNITGDILTKESEVRSLEEKYTEKKNAFDAIKEKLILHENVTTNLNNGVTALASLKVELEGFQASASTAKANAEKRKEQLEAKLTSEPELDVEYKAFQEQVKANEEKSKSLDVMLASISEKNVKLTTVRNEHNEGVVSFNGFRSKGIDKKSEIDKFQVQIDSPTLEVGQTCIACFSPISSLDNYRQHLQSEIDPLKEKLSEIKKDALESKGKNDELKKTIESIEKEIAEETVKKDAFLQNVLPQTVLNQRESDFKSKFADLEATRKELSEINSAGLVDGWEKSIKDKIIEITVKTQAVADLKVQSDAMEKVDTEAGDAIKREMNETYTSVDNSKRDVHILHADMKTDQNKLKDFDIIKKKHDTEKANIETTLSDIRDYDELLVAFSPRGIRSHILQTAIEEVEREANEILPRISSGRLSVTFKTKKAIKKSSKGQSEKLVFESYINDGEKTLPFSMYSGGEKFRISFVVRVALSKLLLRRSNAKLDFLIIDEAVSPLDGGGVDKMMNVINDLQADFKTIIVITHKTEMKKFFDQVIIVNRDENGSTIEIGSGIA